MALYADRSLNDSFMMTTTDGFVSSNCLSAALRDEPAEVSASLPSVLRYLLTRLFSAAFAAFSV